MVVNILARRAALLIAAMLCLSVLAGCAPSSSTPQNQDISAPVPGGSLTEAVDFDMSPAGYSDRMNGAYKQISLYEPECNMSARLVKDSRFSTVGMTIFPNSSGEGDGTGEALFYMTRDSLTPYSGRDRVGLFGIVEFVIYNGPGDSQRALFTMAAAAMAADGTLGVKDALGLFDECMGNFTEGSDGTGVGMTTKNGIEYTAALQRDNGLHWSITIKRIVNTNDREATISLIAERFVESVNSQEEDDGLGDAA